MKNYLFLSFLALLCCSYGVAQKAETPIQPKGKNQAVTFGIYLPLGVFADSHVAGVGVDYSRSRHRFGKPEVLIKSIGWVVNGGINYYIGKTITTAGYDFRYGGYLNLYAMGGAIYNPVKNGNISLTAGPALNIYKASVNAGISVNFLSNYFISDNIAIGPGIIFKKHTNTDALWALTLRMCYAF